MIEQFLLNLFILLFLHALADFTLQTDVMAKGKNRKSEVKNYDHWVNILNRDPKLFKKCWFYWLTAHALIHGGIIALIFPEFWYLGLIEVIIHFIIDFMKCQNKLNPHQDQFLHFIFRIMYLVNMVII